MMNEDTMGILHKNRNHGYCFREWSRDGFVIDYFDIEPKHLMITQKVFEGISKEVEETFKNPSVIGIDESKFDAYEVEPVVDVEKIRELDRDGFFDRATDYLLTSDACEEERAFLFNRGITEDEIVENRLGSTKYVPDDLKELLGLTVHPAIVRFVGGTEVRGILIPFTRFGEVVGVATRCVPFEYMKFSTTAPDLLMGNMDEAYKVDYDALMIVEGKFDQMALASIGMNNVAFIHSAAPSIPQLASILNNVKKYNKRLVLGLDVDQAGLRTMWKISKMAKLMDIDVSYVRLDEGKDHAEAVLKYGKTKEWYDGAESKDFDWVWDGIGNYVNDGLKEVMSYDQYLEYRRGISVDFRK